MQVGRKAERLAIELVAEELRALVGHRAQELVEGLGELRHAVDDQVLGDAVQVEPKALGLVEDTPRSRDILGQGRADDAMVAEGIHGLGRHGVDGVAADESLDIEHIGIGRILGPGGGPEQPLRRGSSGGERFPAGAFDHLQVTLIGDLGVGDGDLATHGLERLGVPGAGLRQPLVDLLVDHGVDAADEEAGDAVHAADPRSRREAILEPREVGVGDGKIGLDAEEQGDVDVDAFGNQGADRRNAGRRAGNLDHHIGPANSTPQPPRLLERRLGIHGQIGRNLQADVAVGAVQRIIERTEVIGGRLDIGDRQALVEVHRRPVAKLHARLQAVIVGVALADRLLENRGIGGHTLEAIALDQAVELAVLEDLAVQIVEPDRLAGVTQGAQGIAHGRVALTASSCRLAASKTCSAVKPKCFISGPMGAEAPKPRMAMISPSRPT